MSRNKKEAELKKREAWLDKKKRKQDDIDRAAHRKGSAWDYADQLV